jgi:hypothetical protein
MTTQEGTEARALLSLIGRLFSRFSSRVSPPPAAPENVSSRLAATLPADCFSAVYRTKR